MIVSIANNYPAGSILRVRDAKQAFAVREFEEAPALNGARHTFLVLDGQQRLTSLYQAFFGVGEHRYFLNLRKLMDGLDFDEAIFHERASSRRAKALESFESQASELQLPLAILRGGSGGFLQWVLKVTNPLPSDERSRMLDALTRLDDNWIKTIDDYSFPVVTLSDKTEPDALCAIFETLNRTGVKLSVFELLTARFWPQNINLRGLWDEARGNYPIIEEFEVDPYYIIQAISLASRQAPSCKRKEVLNLEAKGIDAWWRRAVDGLALGLTILRDDCRVVLPKWLPYQTIMVTMAAVLAKTGNLRTAEAGARREMLKRWFWCSVFGQTYESAANSQTAKDVAEIESWFAGGGEPSSVRDFRFDPNSLFDVTPRQRAVYRGVMCLILGYGSGARDFHTQSIITGKLINEEGIDDHHVFPASYLEKRKGIKESKARDCVLNRTLIDRTTNQMISDRAPSDYLMEIKRTAGFPFDAVLASHCLPTGENSPFWNDDFDGFMAWRKERIWEEIQRVTMAGKQLGRQA